MVMTETVVPRVALPADLPYMLDLHRKNKGALGFLPADAFNDFLYRVGNARAGIVTENGDPTGYILARHSRDVMRIVHACIQYDARRRTHGIALVQWALQTWKPTTVRLKCAGDLASNLFWRDMGFTCIHTDVTHRGRAINTWLLDLTPTLFMPSDVAPQLHVRHIASHKDDTDYIDLLRL